MNEVHYSLMSVCISYVPACKLEWSYDCDLFGTEYTETPLEVTCPDCLNWIRKQENEEIHDQDPQDCPQTSRGTPTEQSSTR